MSIRPSRISQRLISKHGRRWPELLSKDSSATRWWSTESTTFAVCRMNRSSNFASPSNNGFERLNTRIDDVVEEYRDLGTRLGTLFNELEALKLVDEATRRELWALHEQRVRLRLEQAQQELDRVNSMRRTGINEVSTPSSTPVADRPADR